MRPNDISEDKDHRSESAVIASSIAKYVFKRGRRTIAPAVVLENSRLLPETSKKNEPSSANSSSMDDYSLPQKASGPAVQNADRPDPEAVMNATMGPDLGVGAWDRERVEVENSRGMKVAAFMAGLDLLDREFIGKAQTALGQY